MKIGFVKLFIIFLPFLFIGCEDVDIIGKVVIEYENDWSATIILNNSETTLTGNGNYEYIYENPDTLEATVTKQDSSLNRSGGTGNESHIVLRKR